jgi:Na+-translocating ferredoxin:NAD+ oxidoreductase subunit G
MTLEELRSKLGYHSFVLGLVALVTSGALALTDDSTHGAIVAAEARDLQQSLAQVLPDGFADNDLLKDQVILKGDDGASTVVYRARLHGEAKGAVFKVIGHGYAGVIAILMGVDNAGRILGVRVIKHQETPGLGDKIEAAKARWIFDFDGKSLGDPAPEKWAVKKDGGQFDQFAGATITPRGVVKAVKGGLEFYAAHRTEIFAAPAANVASAAKE